MTVLVAVLVGAAALSLGLRATAMVLDDRGHPMDRLALSAIAGTLITAVMLQLSLSYRVYEMGLGLLLSLSPVGLFDLTKWWFRSRGRRSPWLVGSPASRGVVLLRWLFLVAVITGIAAIGAAQAP